MKAIIRDKRVNPRILYIDGKRYILPSNKDIIKDISESAFKNLSSLYYISISEYLENNIVEEQPKQEEQKPVDIPNKAEPDVDVSGLVVEDKLEDSSIVSPVEEPNHVEEAKQVEEPKQVEEYVEENKEEAPVEESKLEEPTEQEEQKPNYSSLTKKELKALVEEKGGDPTGMTKANLLDWLKSNA